VLNFKAVFLLIIFDCGASKIKGLVLMVKKEFNIGFWGGKCQK